MGIVSIVESDINKSIAERAANSVITKLFVELEKLSKTEDPDEEWFGNVLEALKFVQGVEVGFGHAKAYALAIIKANWDNLDVEIRKQYGFAFMNFAKLFTGKQEPTIMGYVRTAEVWFVGQTSPGHQVKVPDRDGTKKPTGTYHYEDFSPYNVDMSKLLYLCSTASKGEMTENLWEMLVDNTVTCDEIEEAVRPKSHVEPESYFFVEGPYLMFKQNLDRVPIAEIEWNEYENNSVAKEGIDRLLSILNIKLDEHYLYKDFKKEFIMNG
jgi:hypothetical protein